MFCEKFKNWFTTNSNRFERIDNVFSEPATYRLYISALKHPNTPGCLSVRLLASDKNNTTYCSTDVGYQHSARNIMTACPFDFEDKTISLFTPTNEPLISAIYNAKNGFTYFDTENILSEEDANYLIISTLKDPKMPSEY